jgi:hypothetical protein
MNRIPNEQREHIVREAIAQRDAVLAGTPRKLWLWKNFVDGRPEYWAFDNPYPTNLTNGDPQTLGQPCGYAIFKPSRDGSHGRTEEQVLREMASVSRAASPERVALPEPDTVDFALGRALDAIDAVALPEQPTVGLEIDPTVLNPMAKWPFRHRSE